MLPYFFAEKRVFTNGDRKITTPYEQALFAAQIMIEKIDISSL